MPEETFRWVITAGVAIVALCALMMAIVSLMLYRVMSKVQTRVDGSAARVESLVQTVRLIISENEPKVTAIMSRAVEITAAAKEISGVAKDQAHRFAELGRDISDRAKAQVARVDSVVDDTVEHFHHAGDNVKAAVMKPVKEANAVFAGVRAAVITLASGRRSSVDHLTQDEEMFI